MELKAICGVEFEDESLLSSQLKRINNEIVYLKKTKIVHVINIEKERDGDKYRLTAYIELNEPPEF